VNRRVLVTRPEGQALCAQLRAEGWDAHAIPTVAIRPAAPGGPLDGAVRRLGTYDWIVLTSAHGVRAVFDRLRDLGLSVPPGPRWAAVGPVTAAALTAEGVPVAAVPRPYLTTAIAAVLGEVAGRRVLLPRADAASPDLSALLRARGAVVDEVVAYHTLEGPEESRAPLARLLAAGVDAVIFTSGSTVRGFARLVDDPAARLAGVSIACIGPVTARAVEDLGLTPAVVAAEHTAEGLLAALRRVELRKGEARAATHPPS